MNPGSVVLSLYQGADDTKSLFYPSDVSGYTAKVQLRRYKGSPVVLELSSPSDGITITTPTSTTSLTIGTGAQTITTQSGLSYAIGSVVRIYSTVNAYNYMEGTVTSYAGTSLVLNVTTTSGSGTLASWNLSSIVDMTFANTKTVNLTEDTYYFDLKLSYSSTIVYILEGTINVTWRKTV